MTPRNLSLVFVPLALFGASNDRPSGNRTTPPTLSSVSPVGVARGVSLEMTIEGLNLGRASAVYFSDPGVKGRILRVKELPDAPDIRLGSNGTPSTVDVGPLPPRNQVTVELEVSPEAEIGPVRFRLQTPLGTSPEGRFLIEPYYGETAARKPNDAPENAAEAYLPTILTGTIAKPGDVHLFKIRVRAGQLVVFENGAALIGSTLDAVVAILAEDQSVVRQFGAAGGLGALRFAHRFETAGVYYIRIADYGQSGKPSHFYRFKAGSFPLVSSSYPLGVEAGKTREIQLRGYGVSPSIRVAGQPSPGREDVLILRPDHSFNELKLPVGREPEIESNGANVAVAAAQRVALPATVNGRLEAPENDFRFAARKGQKLVVEVNAARLGSALDSFVEVLDAAGNPIERASVRALSETSTTLSERDSSTRFIRLQSRAGLSVGDYMMIGGEILRVEEIPDSPDSDVLFDGFAGQRVAYFDTSAEAHSIDQPVYRVQIHPPGRKFPPNGLPVARLFYQNDDGGPGYGKDSLVHFTAPSDGDYIVRLRDIRGAAAVDEAGARPYRLTIREPRPDFRLSVNPRNPNVPAGGCIPVTATALRLDGFDGPIEVSIEGLPAGLKATAGSIPPGQVSATLLLSAASDAALENAAPLVVVGRAASGPAGGISHAANPEDNLKLIALMPKPDVLVTAETKQVEIEAGKTAEIAVSIERQNGFAGRVPVAVMHLPPRVKLADIGLNGVLLNENETRRAFQIQALPNAQPAEQLIYVGGIVETRSGQQSLYAAPQPILLKVKPKAAPDAR